MAGSSSPYILFKVGEMEKLYSVIEDQKREMNTQRTLVSLYDNPELLVSRVIESSNPKERNNTVLANLAKENSKVLVERIDCNEHGTEEQKNADLFSQSQANADIQNEQSAFDNADRENYHFGLDLIQPPNTADYVCGNGSQVSDKQVIDAKFQRNQDFDLRNTYDLQLLDVVPIFQNGAPTATCENGRLMKDKLRTSHESLQQQQYFKSDTRRSRFQDLYQAGSSGSATLDSWLENEVIPVIWSANSSSRNQTNGRVIKIPENAVQVYLYPKDDDTVNSRPGQEMFFRNIDFCSQPVNRLTSGPPKTPDYIRSRSSVLFDLHEKDTAALSPLMTCELKEPMEMLHCNTPSNLCKGSSKANAGKRSKSESGRHRKRRNGKIEMWKPPKTPEYIGSCGSTLNEYEQNLIPEFQTFNVPFKRDSWKSLFDKPEITQQILANGTPKNTETVTQSADEARKSLVLNKVFTKTAEVIGENSQITANSGDSNLSPNTFQSQEIFATQPKELGILTPPKTPTYLCHSGSSSSSIEDQDQGLFPNFLDGSTSINNNPWELDLSAADSFGLSDDDIGLFADAINSVESYYRIDTSTDYLLDEITFLTDEQGE